MNTPIETNRYRCGNCGQSVTINIQYLSEENEQRLRSVLRRFMGSGNEDSHYCKESE